MNVKQNMLCNGNKMMTTVNYFCLTNQQYCTNVPVIKLLFQTIKREKLNIVLNFQTCTRYDIGKHILYKGNEHVKSLYTYKIQIYTKYDAIFPSGKKYSQNQNIWATQQQIPNGKINQAKIQMTFVSERPCFIIFTHYMKSSYLIFRKAVTKQQNIENAFRSCPKCRPMINQITVCSI